MFSLCLSDHRGWDSIGGEPNRWALYSNPTIVGLKDGNNAVGTPLAVTQEDVLDPV